MGTGMMIDGIAASQAIDSSGEILDIEGCDISELVEGRGVLNFEHRGEDAPGASANDIVGEITYAKKIYSAKDCENEREERYWKQVKLPFIYMIAELFDGDGDHDGAKALAATIRHYKTRGKPILVRYSIEGSTLKKEGNRLLSCVARRVACTIKPCNRSCHSDVMSDPNGPDGAIDYDKVPEKDLLAIDSKKSESQNPMYAALGGAVDYEGDPEIPELEKAMTAGGVGGAPSTLTGGAALAREDRGLRTMKNTALAAIRDYPGTFARAKFKTFAKSKMPEASDSFLDHFTDLAEDYHVRRKLTKREAKTAPVEEAAPAKAKPAPIKEATPAKPVIPKSKPKASFRATIRGVKIAPNRRLEDPQFDEEKGILHAPFGSFPLHKPEPEHFNRILSDPKVEEVHNQAMAGWVKVHKLLKEGRLPPEVIMHAALFSQLSPNTPVPMQELMYSHLVDSMEATGADPRERKFSTKTKKDWMGRDQPNQYPEHSKEFFVDHPGIHLKNPSTTTGRAAGDIGGFMLPNDKMANMNKYHQVHDGLVDVIKRHGTDGRAAAAELMDEKHQGLLWNNRRANAIAAGRPDPGKFTGMAVPGLAPKTTRYLLGMVGAGNVFVPDTHMVRHLTGLEQRKDPQTFKMLRELMWNQNNGHILDGIDRWYAKNHPAVQHMLNHPTWGKHFDKPEDAIFPAFWKHWVAIAPDERSRGMYNQNYTEGTTHAPFWDAINPFVDEHTSKAEVDETIPQRTARVHSQYVKDYGEVPASMLYHAYLVPHLLDAAEQRAKSGSDLTFMARAEQLDITLRKVAADFDSHPTLLEPEMPVVHKVHIKVGEKHHPAGRYMVMGGNLHHLEDYHGIIGKFLPEGKINETTISRLHGLKMSPHLRVEQDELQNHEGHVEDAHPPILPTAPPRPRRPSVFDYTRIGHDRPHVLEVHQGQYTLDGKRLSYPEVQTVVGNVTSGAGTLRYRKSEFADKVEALELLYENLAKARPAFRETRAMRQAAASPQTTAGRPMDIGTATAHLRAAVAAGHIAPDVERAWTNHVYEDPMTAGIGNKYAFEEFKRQQRPGVYVSMDGNSFSAVNNAFGHDAGDDAIRALGTAATGAMKEAAPGVGKMFRSGGDEFFAHVPSLEHAARFSRSMAQKLDAIPAIGGAHKLSMSFGLGLNPKHADQALYAAKEQKYLPGQVGVPARQRKTVFAPGQEPNFIHSLVPGHEGPQPLHDKNAAAVHEATQVGA